METQSMPRYQAQPPLLPGGSATNGILQPSQHNNIQPPPTVAQQRPAEVINVPEVVENRRRDAKGNTVVRHYIRGKMIGKGGFAKCFKFTVQGRNKVIAGKVVDKETLQKAKAKAKLFAEINIHLSLDHPFIVGFDTFFEDKVNVYIMLELCNNFTLMELVKRRTKLTEPETAYFAIQLLDAMRYLHHHNIIHRDLKLGNLFLTHDVQIRVGDFGLATQLKTRDERKKTVCGTPNYIAPEILDQKGHSFEVDTWAFGVILYTMLIGKPPFETADVKTTYKKIRDNSYDFPPEHPISGEAQNLISQILQPDPATRPSIEAILNHAFFTAPHVYLPISLPQSILTTRPTFRHEDLVPGIAIVQNILSKPVLPLKSTINISPEPTPNNENMNPNRNDGCASNIGFTNNNSGTSSSSNSYGTNIPPLMRTNSAPSSTMPLQHYSTNEEVQLTRSSSVSNSNITPSDAYSHPQQKQSFSRPHSSYNLSSNFDKENDHPSAALRIKAPTGMNSAATIVSTTSSNTGLGFESVNTADIAGVNLQVDTASSGMQLGINGTDSASSLSGRDTPASSENGGMWLVGLQSAMNRQQSSVVSGNGPLSSSSSTRTDGVMSTSGFSVPLMHANPGMGENVFINSKGKVMGSYTNNNAEPNYFSHAPNSGSASSNVTDGFSSTTSNNQRRALSTIGQQNGPFSSSSSSSVPATNFNTNSSSTGALMASGSMGNTNAMKNNAPQRVPVNPAVPSRPLSSVNTANLPEANVVNAPFAPSNIGQSSSSSSSNKAPFTVWNDSYNNNNNVVAVQASSQISSNPPTVDEDVQMRSPRTQLSSSSAFRAPAPSNTNTNPSSVTTGTSSTGTTTPSAARSSSNNAALHQETLRNIYDTLTLTVPRGASTSPKAPKIWVTQWLDYSSKYGLGYLLSNGTVGIHFNDGTKILISPDGSRFEYVERLCPSQPPNISGITCYVGSDGFTRFCGSVNEFPPAYHKKVTLVRFYRSYLFDQYERRKSYTRGRITKDEIFVNSTTGMFADLHKGGEVEGQVSYVPLPITAEEERCMAAGMSSPYRMGSIPFVKKWIRSRRGVMFRFSSQNVQVASADGSNLILSSDGSVSTYFETSGKRFVMNTQTAITTVEATSQHDGIANASPGSRMIITNGAGDNDTNVPPYMEEAVRRIHNARNIVASFVTPTTNTNANGNTASQPSNDNGSI